jgi:hypothetical protein
MKNGKAEMAKSGSWEERKSWTTNDSEDAVRSATQWVSPFKEPN